MLTIPGATRSLISGGGVMPGMGNTTLPPASGEALFFRKREEKIDEKYPRLQKNT